MTVSMVITPPVFGQSRSDLRTLFFDPVYLEDPDQLLLSSGARSNAPAATTVPENNAEPSGVLDILEDIDAYETRINSFIESGGAFDPRLAQAYLSVGTLYLQAGDFENAVLAFENTMHINRVNQGLFTLEQIEAVRKLIDSNKVSGNFGEADKYHEYLYFLLSQNLEPGSEELTTATLEWADWNMEAFVRMAFQQEEGLAVSGDARNIPSTLLRRRELVAVEDNQFSDVLFVPRSAFLGGGDIRMQSYTPEQLLDPRLRIAEDLYDKLLETDSDNPEVVKRKANIVHLFKSQLDEFVSRSAVGSNIMTNSSRSMRMVGVIRRGYAESREELLALAEAETEMSPQARAQLYIDLADWDLAFERLQRAENSYNQAREILLAAGYSEEAVTDFITPVPARFIPEFATYEHTRAFQNIPESMDIPYIGYIDVSFNKRSNGTLRNIRVEGASENTSQQIRARLVDLLRTVKTRPLMVAGKREAVPDIRVRYYYSY